METHKIGLLIPCTSNNRNWEHIKDSYLYNLTLKTFLLTSNKEHNYIFYVGVDKNDKIYDNLNNQQEIIKFTKVFKNIEFKFIYMDEVKKGHLTKMWNILFRRAYDENCEYFFQCGDDMIFATNGWVNDCIEILKKNKGFGLAGPINNNPNILTQAFVSRRHMEIFGWFFPEEIMNWCCDDWYNWVYAPNKLLFPLRQHFCDNKGGAPRYDIDGNAKFRENGIKNGRALREKTMALAQKHWLLVDKKLQQIK